MYQPPLGFSISCSPCTDSTEGRACHKGAAAQETLFQQTAEAVSLPWENCPRFPFAPLPSSSRSVKAAVGDRMPDQMEQRVLANPPFVTNK